MIGTIQENVSKVHDSIPFKYMLTWDSQEFPALMNESKFDEHYTFDTVAKAIERAYYCGYVNGHMATMQGDYEEKEGNNNEQDGKTL